METKLKALKVVDLKSILAKAKASAPAKSTKVDLIARILTNNDAILAYNSLYPSDDLLAPPEECVLFLCFTPHLIFFRIDWAATQELTSKPVPNVSISSAPPQPPVSQPTKAAIPVANPILISTDPELEKRKQRAARFGIPFVESSKDAKPPRKAGSQVTSALVKSTQDNVCTFLTFLILPLNILQGSERVKARAARFGLEAPITTTPASNTGQKRAAPAEHLDVEEEERRRKRAERFGLGKPVSPPNPHQGPIVYRLFKSLSVQLLEFSCDCLLYRCNNLLFLVEFTNLCFLL